ncbi:GntR family transcriptional regulator [Streptomyces sp. DT20]|uniref:GntR family transcriptional regulator n=1 Tax=unclassified Streptomyces TaxID=2593676 RepID=UPI00093A42B7|nr:MULTISPECIES: GntR family transcriptional regulator [unclassified Streptomyces]OKK23707.1 GntR family transcriptional regulator [Streptomyces sp. CB02488]WRZ15638.1 GntR family transcriptional regulator [Streptomyces sp. NBC_00341]
MTTTESPDASESHADHAEHTIRAGILSGTYPPGSRLRERELSEALGFSRIPVREALTRLTGEGLVVISPRRGASVRNLSLRDVAELFDLRLSLEVFAARRAAEACAAGRGGDRLRALMEAAQDATRRGDAHEIPAANTALHAEIVAMTGNRLLQDALQPSLGLVQWLFTLTGGLDPSVQCAEHQDICAAIYAGKPDLADALAYAHIERGRGPSLAKLAEVLPAE